MVNMTLESEHPMISYLPKITTVAAFIGCVIGANWALDTYGFVDLVGPGVVIVPAGVYFAGLAFGVRDVLHELDQRLVVPAIVVGAFVSWWIEPSFAVASGAAFLLAELADFAVYTPLRNRNWPAAVAASNIAGSVIDSLLFLWIAFDTTDGWVDLTIGKAAMIAPAVGLVWGVRQLRPGNETTRAE